MKSKMPATDVPEAIPGRIFTVLGQKVILDSDLAALDGVATQVLNQAIKRNAEKFPAEFMFRLAPQETTKTWPQIATSSSGSMRSRFATASEKRNIRFLPFRPPNPDPRPLISFYA